MQKTMKNRRNEHIVYMVTNILNNKKYIGWCVDFKERKARHLNEVKKGTNTHFYSAIKKYGEDNFKWEILKSNLNSQEECKSFEILMIEKFDTYYSGYNSTKGGDGGNTYSKLTEEQKLEMKRKCSLNNKKYFLGKKLTSEHIEKLKNANRTKQYKAVVQLDKNLNFIKEFDSIKNASIETNIASQIISNVCIGRGSYKTAGGYKWKFKKDYLDYDKC